MKSKNLHITKYGMAIDEEHYKCDILIEAKLYNLTRLIDEPLTYKVDFPNNQIIVFDENKNQIVFDTDKKLSYYAIKSLEILIHVIGAPPLSPVQYTLKAVLI